MPTRSASSASVAWPPVPEVLPDSMSAVIVDRFGDAEVLRIATVARPVPGPHDVLVRVAAVSVGRFLDVTLRAGRHPVTPELPHVPGADHAGTVAAVGAAVGAGAVAVGDHVAVWPALGCGSCPRCAEGRTEACPTLRLVGVHRHGADAEYAVVPATAVHRVPTDLDPVTAASLALAGPVAMNQLAQAGLRPGDWVLVQGAASALGSTTAALARHLGARVIGTSRTGWKRERLSELGVVAALDPNADDFAEQVDAVTGGAGVAVAVDDLGEPQIFARTMDVLAPCGVVVSSGGFLGGRATVDLTRLYLRNQRILGVRTGNPASAAALWAEVDRGFRPVVDHVFPAAAVAAAHRHLESDDNLGRVVLTTGSAADWAPATTPDPSHR